jgi:putative membrane protein
VRGDQRPINAAETRRDRRFLLSIGLVSCLVVAGIGLLLLWGRPGEVAHGSRGSFLPALNAVLNGTAAGILSVGYLLIRRKKIVAHQRCMVTAFGVSCLFLISYLIHHLQVGSVPFVGRGWIRPVYYTLLSSHIVLAALIVPMALLTLYRALSGQFARHVRLARWTLPLWLYVSVTGVIVYLMLYQLSPSR